jgi:hypothetical protein
MRLVCTFVLFSALVWAQSFQGSLRGRVTDPKDAVVPLAKVTLIEEATSVASTTVTNDKGEYSFPVLNPGTYELDVEAPGFKKLAQKGITIVTQTANTQDAKLDIGQVTETIDVTADAELLATSEASTGTDIDRQKLEDIPNLGRDPFMLARLSEGVVWTGNPKFDRMEDQSGQSSVSIAGGPTQTNNYTLDGVSITDSTNRAVIIPSMEGVQEMKVQANTYDASMGRTGGGVFNATMRSGENRMHGSLFGIIRETSWLANTYFANAAGIPVLSQPFKNYGDSLGGPVRIPKIYDGRNKTFFFVTTEGYRMFDAATTVDSVPTALERVGNFSQSMYNKGTAANPQLVQWAMYDPMSTNLTTGARTQFPNNIIPPSQINPIGLALASYYPLPTGPTTTYGQPNASLVVNVQDRADQGIFKVDHEATKWLKLSATYIHYGSTEPSNTFFPNQGTPNQTIYERHVDGLSSNAVATLNASTVLTVRFGQNRFPDFDPNSSNGFNLTTLGFSPAVNALTPGYPAFPSITTGEFAAYGGGNTPWTVYHSQSVDTELAKFVGKHSIKAGFDYRLIADASETATGPGSYGFTSGFTSASGAKNVTGTGGGLASMLLGDPASGTITKGSFFNDYTHYTAFFIQDDYRITPKLTLNFGFRGEHEPQPEESNNKLTVDANLGIANPLQASIPSLVLNGQVEYAGVNGNPRYAGNPLSIKLGPRFGFAYSMNPKTVFRGGYGVFWIPQSFSAQSAAGYSQATSLTSSINGGYTPYANLSNPYPNGLTPIAGNTLGGLANIGNSITTTEAGNRSAGYVEQMSLDIQRQITKNASIWGGYIGSHTLDQPFTVALDQLNPSYFAEGSSALSGTVANPFFGLAPNTTALGSAAKVSQATLLTPYPEYTSVSLLTNMGRATYYSFYGKGQWRAKYGLTLNATYTWSRNMALSAPQNYDGNIVAQGWARAATDTPNSYSMSVSYALPFGKGQTFLTNAPKAVDFILGGWSLDGQQLIHSGVPIAITQTNGMSSTCNGCGQYATATGVSAATSGAVTSRLTDWVNLAAFSVTPAYQFGNVSPRINVYSPSLFNIDASLHKTVTFKEYYHVQFRAEALNLTNTVLFAAPTTNVSSPSTFGAITSQTNFPRLFQISVRITF